MRLTLCFEFLILLCSIGNCQKYINDDQTAGPGGDSPLSHKPLPDIKDNQCISNVSLQNTLTKQYESWLSYLEVAEQRIKLIKHRVVTVGFDAFNMSFKLHLEECTFGRPDIEIVNHDGEIVKVEERDLDVYYCGYDSMSSGKTHGYFHNGLFIGVVNTKTEDFYIENTGMTRWPIVYRSLDIKVWNIMNKWKVSKPLRAHRNYKYNSHRARTRRASIESVACSIHAYVDYTYFSTLGEEQLRTTINKIYFQLLTANNIFKSTDFNGDDQSDGIGVVMARITIIQDANALINHYLPTDELDSPTVLDSFSKLDHSRYCLAALFVNRDFLDEVLGIAWRASSSAFGYPGGICEDILYDDQRVSHSYNSLVVSSRSYGRVVPEAVAALTLTHEIGHAFGAPHDNTTSTVCSPGGSAGNYLMYPYSQSSHKPNHWKFSPCSIQHMWPTIVLKGDCFIDAQAPQCGDGLIQEGEQCDCGFPANCADFDHCCEPFNTEDSINACRLKSTSVCSPAASLCCTDKCTLDVDGRICSRASECMNAAYCDGLSEDCPTAVPKPDGSLCQQSTAICSAGFCSLSRCSVIGLEQCYCSGNSEEDCQLCCLTQGGECRSAAKLGLSAENGDPLYLPPGFPCRWYKGVCREDHLCYSPDKIDTIDRMEAFFTRSTLDRITAWIRKNGLLFTMLIMTTILLAMSAWVLYQISDVPSPEALAKQSAELLVLYQQAQFELACIDNELELLNEQEQALKQPPNTYKKWMDWSNTLGRVEQLFPTVPYKVRAKAFLTSKNELELEEQLIKLGYSMVEQS